MSETTYIILPGTIRTAWNPVARFFHTEDGFDDPWQYEVVATPTGLDWKPGHNPVRLALSREEEARVWADAMAENDCQPF